MTLSERSTIVVTGAGGKTGRAMLSAFGLRGLVCVAWVRREDQVAEALAHGAAEARIVDFSQPETFASALAEVDHVYHICPNMHPDEVSIASNLIEAASQRRIKRFILHSVMHPQIEAMPHHWRKLRVEEMVLASGLGFNLVQPSAYLQNLQPYFRSARDRGFFELPFSVDAPISMVDLADVASAVSELIVDAAHAHGTYVLAGQAYNHRNVARVFSAVLGRQIEARQIPVDQWAGSARAAELAPGRIDDLISMFNYYDRHGFVGSFATLESLLGQPVVGLDEWVGEVALEREA